MGHIKLKCILEPTGYDQRQQGVHAVIRKVGFFGEVFHINATLFGNNRKSTSKSLGVFVPVIASLERVSKPESLALEEDVALKSSPRSESPESPRKVLRSLIAGWS